MLQCQLSVVHNTCVCFLKVGGRDGSSKELWEFFDKMGHDGEGEIYDRQLKFSG